MFRLREKNNAVGIFLISNKRIQWVGSSNEIGVEMFLPQIKGIVFFFFLLGLLGVDLRLNDFAGLLVVAVHMTTTKQGTNLPILKLGKNENPKLDSATFEFLVPATMSNLMPTQAALNQRKSVVFRVCLRFGSSCLEFDVDFTVL